MYDIYSPASFSVTLMRILTTAVTRRSSLKSPCAPSSDPVIDLRSPARIRALSNAGDDRVSLCRIERRRLLDHIATAVTDHSVPTLFPTSRVPTQSKLQHALLGQGYLVYMTNVVNVSHATSSGVRCSQDIVAGLGRVGVTVALRVA